MTTKTHPVEQVSERAREAADKFYAGGIISRDRLREHIGAFERDILAATPASDSPALPIASTTLTGSRVEKLEWENARLLEALTPSGDTKYAYIGEFSWTEWLADENGIEQGHERTVPWDTIKEIMAAIRERALNGGSDAE
jgi:hypothetical protein